MTILTVGIDLAKNALAMLGVNRGGTVLPRQFALVASPTRRITKAGDAFLSGLLLGWCSTPQRARPPDSRLWLQLLDVPTRMCAADRKITILDRPT